MLQIEGQASSGGAGVSGATDAADSGAASADSAPAGDPIKEAVGFFKDFDADKAYDFFVTYGIPAVKALLLLFLALLLASWMRRIVSNGLERAKVEITLARFLGNLAKWAILILAGVTILGLFGIQTASLAAVLAAMGFAIGLAMQGTLGNLAAGVMLLVFRPFKVGHVVNLSGVTGTVNEIELFTTSIDTFDNRRFIVPNGSIFGAVIENMTYHETRRVDVNVGVEYRADIDRTREVLERTVISLADVMKDPAPVVVLGDLGESSVGWTVRAWCQTDKFWDVKQALTRAIKLSLDEAGIGIPFPQREIRIVERVRERAAD